MCGHTANSLLAPRGAAKNEDSERRIYRVWRVKTCWGLFTVYAHWANCSVGRLANQSSACKGI